MTVGIKYCGGCNPVYDRSAAVEALKKRYPGHEYVSSDSVCDIMLVVCGCAKACVDTGSLNAKKQLFVLTSEKNFGEVRDYLDTEGGGISLGDGDKYLGNGKDFENECPANGRDFGNECLGTGKDFSDECQGIGKDFSYECQGNDRNFSDESSENDRDSKNECPGGKRVIGIGDEASLSRIFYMDDVKKFAALTGDYNPLHTDMLFANRTEYKRPVVHGVLVSSLLSTVMGMKLPGAGCILAKEQLRFYKPVFFGDSVTATVRFTACMEMEDRYIGSFSGLCTNQNGEVLILGTFRQIMLKSLFDVKNPGERADEFEMQ